MLPDQTMRSIVSRGTSADVYAETGALRVHLRGGARMEITDVRQAALAAELLRALTSQRPLSC